MPIRPIGPVARRCCSRLSVACTKTWLRVSGSEYPMQKHGFARKSMFELVERNRTTARCSGCATIPKPESNIRSHSNSMPNFESKVPHCHQTVTVRNRDTADLPFSFGYHPAFAWPLPFGGRRADHVIRFAEAEPGALRAGNSLTAPSIRHPKASPVDGDMLKLTDDLFADDALVWEQINSRSLTYGAPGFPSLRIDFPDTPALGIWTKPGAAFVCVEPWAGHCRPRRL